MKDFLKRNYLIKNIFIGEKINDKGEKVDGHITDEVYLTFINIWNRFNLKNVTDYHGHYLKKDVLLLADVFEKFTSELSKFYNLDPSHYSPGMQC